MRHYYIPEFVIEILFMTNLIYKYEIKSIIYFLVIKIIYAAYFCDSSTTDLPSVLYIVYLKSIYYLLKTVL